MNDLDMKKIFGLSLIVIFAILGGVFVYRNSNAPSINQGSNNPMVPAVVETTSTQVQAVIDLKDGDAYTFRLQAVKKTIAGREVDALTYSGTVPGPTIRVPQGATIHLTLKNDLDR